jgi:hypothetical protein
MRLYPLLAAALLSLPLCGRLSAGQINFVNPLEGAQLPAVQKAAVLGNVVPATATLTINGEKITVNSNGAFIAYLPVSGGDFAFNARLSDGTTAQRRIKVGAAQERRPPAGAMWLEMAN